MTKKCGRFSWYHIALLVLLWLSLISVISFKDYTPLDDCSQNRHLDVSYWSLCTLFLFVFFFSFSFRDLFHVDKCHGCSLNQVMTTTWSTGAHHETRYSIRFLWIPFSNLQIVFISPFLLHLAFRSPMTILISCNLHCPV